MGIADSNLPTIFSNKEATFLAPQKFRTHPMKSAGFSSVDGKKILRQLIGSLVYPI